MTPSCSRWGTFKAWGAPMHEANQSSSPEPQLARWHSRGPSLPHTPSNNLDQGCSPNWAPGKGQRLLYVQQLQTEGLDGHFCQQQVTTKQTPTLDSQIIQNGNKRIALWKIGKAIVIKIIWYCQKSKQITRTECRVRNKPTLFWSINLLQRSQKFTTGERQSLQ